MNNVIYIEDRKLYVFDKENLGPRMKEVPPGFYKCIDVGGMFQFIPAFEPIEEKETLVEFQDGAFADIFFKCRNFFCASTKEKYKTMGINHKMAMVLYGPPGTGKTKTAELIMRVLIKEYNAICIDGTPLRLSGAIKFIKALREKQNNPIILFVDEAENDLSSDEKAYLTFLDGNDSFDNFIYIGCTNYLKKIPKRIRERRSRIKHLVEIKNLPIEVYKQYIKGKVPSMEDKDIAKFAYLSAENQLTIDELKHALIDHVMDSSPIEQSIKTVKEYSSQEDWDD